MTAKNSSTEKKRVQISANIQPDISVAVSKIANHPKHNRSFSQMVEIILSRDPEVRKVIEQFKKHGQSATIKL